jgi:hypothetical protein
MPFNIRALFPKLQSQFTAEMKVRNKYRQSSDSSLLTEADEHFGKPVNGKYTLIATPTAHSITPAGNRPEGCLSSAAYCWAPAR